MAFGKNWFGVKINHDYFTLSSRYDNLKYFFGQGNILDHIVDRYKWYIGPNIYHVFDFPSHVDIEASSRCQMACPMCGRHLMKDLKFGDMDFNLYKKIIDECVKEKVYSIKLSWRGEPLLNPRIVDMVRYAKEQGIKDVAFLTNGERLNISLSRKLIDAGLDWISISFDGLGETYERIRYPAKFGKVVQEIKNLKAEREKRGLKKPLIRVQSIQSAISDNAEEYKAFWEPIADRINFIADQIRSNESKDFEHDSEYICQSPWQRICIIWDGRIAQCHGDYQEKNILGDFNKNSLREIWHGSHFQELRYLMRNKRRLETGPCSICCDGGKTEEDTVELNGAKIKVLKYAGQDLETETMDARPKSKRS